MDWLDQELQRAFERQNPPADFAARTLARAGRGRHFPMPRWAVAAAATLIVTAGAYAYRWQQGEAAKNQVLLAIHITAGKVNHIQMQVIR